jgi:hypothetical protein
MGTYKNLKKKRWFGHPAILISREFVKRKLRIKEGNARNCWSDYNFQNSKTEPHQKRIIFKIINDDKINKYDTLCNLYN